MSDFMKSSRKCLAVCVVGLFFFSSVSSADDNSVKEGIFIETVSELHNGQLTLDEIRTRPTTISSTGKKFSIETDGYYVVEDDLAESRYVAEERARADAKRLASEQAILHVKTVSEMKKGKLTRDEVYTISVTVLQIESESVTVEVLEDSKIRYRCHLKALLDEVNIFDKLEQADKEKFHESVRRAIEIERETARLNSELAVLKEKYKKVSKAEREKIAVELEFNEKKFTAVQWNEKGFEFYSQNDFDKANECFSKAVEFDSSYSPSWNNLGYIANYQRNFDKAVEYCYKAIEIDPNYAAAWNNLGYAYRYKGNFDKSIECYKKALELEPSNISAHINLGNVYDAMKNHDEAIQSYEKALQLTPDYANAWNSLGYAYIHKGDFDKGLEYCTKALKIDNHYATAWNGLAYSYNQKRKFYKAIECCKKAIALSKNYANAWNNLGYACSKVSRYEDSFAAYSRAVKIAPNVQLYRDNLNIARKRIDSFKSL